MFDFTDAQPACRTAAAIISQQNSQFFIVCVLPKVQKAANGVPNSCTPTHKTGQESASEKRIQGMESRLSLSRLAFVNQTG
jgi:hypothetical protein